MCPRPKNVPEISFVDNNKYRYIFILLQINDFAR